jgi:hypothetical protein
MIAGAAIALRRRRIVRRFREAGATSARNAIPLKSLGIRPNWIFAQMMNRGVFETTPTGQYFLNDSAATEYLYERRMRALAIGAVFVLLFLAWCLPMLSWIAF